jgi:NAD(P)-dependent dehydrogenase (short-subunit alcohol dehydrogenase family)
MTLLQNRVIIIAGGFGLIGQSFVEACLENGANVLIADIKMDEKSKIFLDSLSKRFGENKACFIQFDITSKDSIQVLIQKSKEIHSQIDAFVNTTYPRNKNYGQVFEEVSFSDFCENCNLHLGGYFLTSQQFALFFKEQGFGHIINVSSIYGVIPPRFDIYDGIENHGKKMTMPVEYAPIKSGIIMLTKYMARYFAFSNVRFNCISPGGVFANQPEEFVKRYNKYALSKGMIDAKDLNGTLVYLLSDLSQVVNGQNIIVDDGWTL